MDLRRGNHGRLEKLMRVVGTIAEVPVAALVVGDPAVIVPEILWPVIPGEGHEAAVGRFAANTESARLPRRTRPDDDLPHGLGDVICDTLDGRAHKQVELPVLVVGFGKGVEFVLEVLWHSDNYLGLWIILC